MVRLSTLALLGGLIVIGATQEAAASPAFKTVKCTYTIRGQSSSPATKGIDLGFATCGKPLGHGIYSGAFKDTITPPNVTETGTFKQFFNTGTIHGTYRFSGKVTDKVFKGTAKVTGGTGTFRHATGTAQLTCTLGNNSATCTGVGKYKGL